MPSTVPSTGSSATAAVSTQSLRSVANFNPKGMVEPLPSGQPVCRNGVTSVGPPLHLRGLHQRQRCVDAGGRLHMAGDFIRGSRVQRECFHTHRQPVMHGDAVEAAAVAHRPVDQTPAGRSVDERLRTDLAGDHVIQERADDVVGERGDFVGRHGVGELDMHRVLFGAVGGRRVVFHADLALEIPVHLRLAEISEVHADLRRGRRGLQRARDRRGLQLHLLVRVCAPQFQMTVGDGRGGRVQKSLRVAGILHDVCEHGGCHGGEVVVLLAFRNVDIHLVEQVLRGIGAVQRHAVLQRDRTADGQHSLQEHRIDGDDAVHVLLGMLAPHGRGDLAGAREIRGEVHILRIAGQLVGEQRAFVRGEIDHGRIKLEIG